MIRTWPHIAVSDVRASSRWYQQLLGCRSMSEPDHPHRELFDALSDTDGTTIVCLVSWKDHELPLRAGEAPNGVGLELYFVSDRFDAAWQAARALGPEVVREPYESEGGYRTRSFVLRDPDGYFVRVGDGAGGWFGSLLPGWLQRPR